MLIRTTYEKLVFVVLSILLVATVAKDWFDFYSCGGAVGQCISDAGLMQLYTKSGMSLMMTLLAFMVAKRAFCNRDAGFLRLAFVFSLLADFSFSLLKAVVPSVGTLSTVLGIGFFMVFQIVLIYRHSRTDESDKSFPKAYWIVAAIAVVFIALGIAGVVGALVAEVLVYGTFVITSMVVAILAPRKAYFPKANVSFVRWGMVAFFFGDVLVGLSMLSGDDHSTMQLVSNVANNFIWLLYVPAQLMLIRAAAKAD